MADELQPLMAAWFPPTWPVSVTTVMVTQDAVRFQLTATAPTVSCPGCAVPCLPCIAGTNAG